MLRVKRSNGRKAAAEVFTVILMLAIVAVAGITMVQLGLSSIFESEARLNVFTVANKNKILEKFITDDVWFYNAGNVNVSVVNVGKIPVNITAISFNDTDVTPTVVTILGIDQSAIISLEFSWSSGEVYRVEVMSERGNIYESYWKA